MTLKRVPQNAVDVKFGRVEKNFTEYPTLIYDGPFSDKVINGKPKDLNGENINVQKAKEIAKRFVVGADVGNIIETSSGKGSIETFGLEMIPKNNDRSKSIHIDVTKKGGHVLWMINPRTVPQKKLTDQQASNIAKDF